MKTTFYTIPIMALGLMMAQPVLADSGHGHDQDLHETNDSPSPADAWTMLQNEYEEAQSLSDAGTLSSMHELTDRMTEAVKTLQSSADDNERLNMALSQMQQMILNLHVKADAGDAAGTVSALQKFKGVLSLLDAYLPENVRSSDSGGAHEDMNHGNNGHTEKETRKILYWVAPMDPDFRRDEPGKSPMGMDLVPVYEEKMNEETIDNNQDHDGHEDDH